MELRILFIGDIVGRPGREAVEELLPGLRNDYNPDLIFANAENATHGHGLSREHYKQLLSLGIDAFSMGDHIWDKEDLLEIIDKPDTMLVRPANYRNAPGKRYLDITVKGKRVRLINILGRVFMQPSVDNPFHTMDELLAIAPKPDVVLVDVHAEATSEKRMLAEYLNGRVQLVVGTHTHVPTADAQLLEGDNTAFISDLGMVGPRNSSLGADKEPIIKSFLTGQPWRYSLGTGQCELGAAFCIVDVTKQRATHLEHIRRFTNS